MWGGGRPDDITVIVSRVVDTEVADAPPKFSAFTGPGPPPPEVLQRPPVAPTAAEPADLADA